MNDHDRCRSLPRRARLVAALLTSLAALAPPAAHGDDTRAPELVAEALFLRDDLPPGGRDLNLSIGVAEGEPDPETGRTSFAASPRLQLAMALGERFGFTADVGLVNDGATVDAPAASLKALLRAPDAGTTGLAASLDLFGSTQLDETEAGLGIGAIRSFGRITLRTAVGVASGVSSWSPHVHGGFSGALALGARYRVLGEVVVDGTGGELALGAGPTVKVALTERTAFMAGALFQVEPVATPAFTVQLTTSL